MPEPRADMLPDEAATISDVEPVKKQAPKVDPVIEETDEPAQPETPKGFVPYQALDEERRKRLELKRKVEELELKSSTPDLSDDELSDEGKVLKNQLAEANLRIARMEEDRVRDKIAAQFPVIADKQDEFDEFRSQYPSLPYDKAAKLFIVENGLEPAPKRKGLEKPSGGSKNLPDPGNIKASDIDRMMKGDERTFMKKIRSGEIDPDKIVSG